MEFKFAVATDITDVNFVKELYPEYERIYILRILKGYDEEYEKNDDMYLLEHQLIPKLKEEMITSMYKLRKVLQEDDGGNYDHKAFHTLEECINVVDGGYGIN